MKEEIEAAADFLVRLVGKLQPEGNPIPPQLLEQFKQRLTQLFHDKYQDHWFPDRPSRGQAYRCIRLNGGTRPDPIIEQAASYCGIKYSDLHLPVELTLWVDPKEVSCRFGEHEGSYCTIASFEKKNNHKTDSVENAIKLSDSDSSGSRSSNTAGPTSGERSPRRSGSNRSSPVVSFEAATYNPPSPPCYTPAPKAWYQQNSPPPLPFAYQPANRSSRYLVQVHLAFVQQPRYPWNNLPMGQLVTA